MEMKPYRDLSNIRFGIPGARAGRPCAEETAKQFGFPITFGHLEPRIYEHTHSDCSIYLHPTAKPFFGVTAEGPDLDKLLRRIRAVLRLHLVSLWRTKRTRDDIESEGARVLESLGEHAEGVKSLVADIAERSIQKGAIPPRAQWAQYGMLQHTYPPNEENFPPKIDRPSQDVGMENVLKLNLRLLHEIKGLRAEFTQLQAQFTALAGGMAQRPQVEPPDLDRVNSQHIPTHPDGTPTHPAQPSTDDLFAGGSAPPSAPKAAQNVSQRPVPAPNPAAAAKMGLKSMPAMPNTKEQKPEEVHRNKVIDTSRPNDLRGADAIGESLAFDDMMNGR
jgi:hypothetical protein